jgi:hypothetical protein
MDTNETANAMAFQAANTNANDHFNVVIGGVCAIFVAIVIPLIRDFWKDRRERENDAVSQEYLREISDHCRSLGEKQERSNTLMAEHIAKSDSRHDENIRTMDRLCKATCMFGFVAKPGYKPQDNP